MNRFSNNKYFGLLVIDGNAHPTITEKTPRGALNERERPAYKACVFVLMRVMRFDNVVYSTYRFYGAKFLRRNFPFNASSSWFNLF